ANANPIPILFVGFDVHVRVANELIFGWRVGRTNCPVTTTISAVFAASTGAEAAARHHARTHRTAAAIHGRPHAAGSTRHHSARPTGHHPRPAHQTRPALAATGHAWHARSTDSCQRRVSGAARYPGRTRAAWHLPGAP